MPLIQTLEQNNLNKFALTGALLCFAWKSSYFLLIKMFKLQCKPLGLARSKLDSDPSSVINYDRQLWLGKSVFLSPSSSQRIAYLQDEIQKS